MGHCREGSVFLFQHRQTDSWMSKKGITSLPLRLPLACFGWLHSLNSIFGICTLQTLRPQLYQHHHHYHFPFITTFQSKGMFLFKFNCAVELLSEERLKMHLWKKKENDFFKRQFHNTGKRWVAAQTVQMCKWASQSTQPQVQERN